MATVAALVEHRDRVEVGEPGRGAGLAGEPVDEDRVGRQRVGHHLDGDEAVEALVDRGVHRRHPAPGDPRQDAVAALEDASDQRVHRQVGTRRHAGSLRGGTVAGPGLRTPADRRLGAVGVTRRGLAPTARRVPGRVGRGGAARRRRPARRVAAARRPGPAVLRRPRRPELPRLRVPARLRGARLGAAAGAAGDHPHRRRRRDVPALGRRHPPRLAADRPGAGHRPDRGGPPPAAVRPRGPDPGPRAGRPCRAGSARDGQRRPRRARRVPRRPGPGRADHPGEPHRVRPGTATRRRPARQRRRRPAAGVAAAGGRRAGRGVRPRPARGGSRRAARPALRQRPARGVARRAAGGRGHPGRGGRARSRAGSSRAPHSPSSSAAHTRTPTPTAPARRRHRSTRGRSRSEGDW